MRTLADEHHTLLKIVEMGPQERLTARHTPENVDVVENNNTVSELHVEKIMLGNDFTNRTGKEANPRITPSTTPAFKRTKVFYIRCSAFNEGGDLGGFHKDFRRNGRDLVFQLCFGFGFQFNFRSCISLCHSGRRETKFGMRNGRFASGWHRT